MVSDDCRPELPMYGQDYVVAPNLAKLAARGLTFMHVRGVHVAVVASDIL